MQKKFPDYIRSDKFGNGYKNNVFDKNKLAGIKNQIDKLFI